MNVEQAIDLALTQINSDTSRLDSEILLCYALEKNKTWIKTWPDYQLSDAEQSQYESLIERRAKGEPIAYITGEREFWTLNLATNSSTLIPRPETELLVEQALESLSDNEASCVLDLGTGTGAIALAIASERSKCEVLGVDLNDAAVELAKKNAKRNNILNAKFKQSSWFENISIQQFDLIVSNPPYVAEGDPHLEQGDLIFEPNSALIAKDEGYADIKLIIERASQFLKFDGGLLFEHGYQQAEKVREIFKEYGYSDIQTVKDLSGLDRVTKGLWRE